jgi:hypothetical protein
MKSRLLMALATLAVLGWGAPKSRAGETVDYLQQIKPLLTEKCIACHGVLKQKGKLRLDTAALARKGGKHGPALRPGDADKSLLIERVTAEEGRRMPPDDEPLTAPQISLLRRWIHQGAAAPADEQPQKDSRDHWAFRTPIRPPIPKVTNPAWVRNPIDAFVAQQHEKHQLIPQTEAPRELLIRRLYLDLIGMPPTAQEMNRLDQDHSASWYEQLVDRLLGDPRYGERWGRHWMDIWRYSDWWGLGGELRNSQKHIWHWRDWIIESLHVDVPYDEMVRQMLAADELYPNDLTRLRATGFLARNFFLFNRDQWLDETVEHVSKAFLGLTMNCVKCHDHKFDPFPQRDYYRLRAFFEPYQVRIDIVPGEADLSRDGIPCVFDGRLDVPTYLYVRGQEKNPDKSVAMAPDVPSFLSFREMNIQPIALPIEAWQPERRAWVVEAYLKAARQRVTAAQAALANVRKQQGKEEISVAESALAVAEAGLQSVISRAEASRAAWAGRDKRAQAEKAIRAERQLAVTKARHGLAEAQLRLARAPADQKAAREKELTQATEAVAQMERTAAGPVGPSDTFTAFEGARWSQTRFLNTTRSDPTVRFPSTSTGRRKALAAWITDARNPLTARVGVNHLWSRHMGTGLVSTVFDFGCRGAAPTNRELLDWLATELVESGWSMKHIHRLIVTSATYRLSSSSKDREANVARDPDNVYWWRRSAIRLEAEVIRDSICSLSGVLDFTQGGPPVPSQAQSNRRSVYFFHSNNERNKFLTTFDEARVQECYRRDQSIVPQQALALTNSGIVRDASQRIADRLSGDQPSDTLFVRRAFRFVLGTSPSDRELAVCLQALAQWRKLPDAATARTSLIAVLFNHNDFVTLR